MCYPLIQMDMDIQILTKLNIRKCGKFFSKIIMRIGS